MTRNDDATALRQPPSTRAVEEHLSAPGQSLPSARRSHQDRDYDQPSQDETGDERKRAMQWVAMEIVNVAMPDIH
jgi:hypothetical protein